VGRTQSALLLLSAFCALGETGCKKKAQLVVGVDAQPSVASQVGKLHVKASVGPNVLVEKDIVPKQGNEKLAALESPFPFEVPLEADPGAQVDVLIEAFRAGPNNTVADTPMLVRRSHAPFIAGAAPKLDRLQLESSCIVGVPGFKGPACTAPQSCAGGRCIDPTLLEEDLEPYVASWATTRPDVCRPADAGAPVVVAGTGATDFAPLADGQTLAPEKGPQGGHHLWIALRMKNLRQAGSVVTLTGEQPGTGLKVPPTSFVFTFEKDSGGFCKLYGLRFQLDNSSTPVTKFLAQPLDVKIQVKDQTGAEGEATIHVNVAANTVG
jgi:hypothetical protein